MIRLVFLTLALSHALFALPHTARRQDELDREIELLERALIELEREAVPSPVTCSDEPCGSGTCISKPDGSPYCQCPEGYMGEFCDDDRIRPMVCDLVPHRYFYDRKEGYFTSPGYPEGYPADNMCPYFIGAADAKKIELTFLDVDLQPQGDEVFLCIGSGPSVDPSGERCLESLPAEPIELMGDRAWVFFQSSSYNPENRKGFKLKFRIDGDECEPNPCKEGVQCVDEEYTHVCEGSTKAEELIIVGKEAQQSSDYDSRYTADKPVDGNSDSDLINGGSCSHTGWEANPWWKVSLGGRHCISKISVVNRGDGSNDRLTNAIAEARTVTDGEEVDAVCGSPVTAEQAAVLGGTVTFECDPPLEAQDVIITIPSEKEVFLQLCEVRLWEVPLDECQPQPGPTKAEELIIVGKEAQQSSDYDSRYTADKPVDGNSDSDLINGGSCSHTGWEANPWWKVSLGGRHCISKISVVNRGDGSSDRLTNAIAEARTVTDGEEVDAVCGSPVTAEQAAVLGGTVTFECDPPLEAQDVIITIPSEKEVFLQLCEVRLWEVPLDECQPQPDSTKAKELIIVGKEAQQSSDYDSRYTADKPVDGNSDSDLINGGSCSHTGWEANPWWKVSLGGRHCISKISVVNRGDGSNDRLTNAIAEARTVTDGEEVDAVCGSPVTAEQAAVLGGTVTFECDPPLEALDVIITIPSEKEVFLQLCEVRLWEVPLDECQTQPDIDECASNPCPQNATCKDEVNGFLCECPAGYQGASCEINTDECASNPCQNGVCEDGVDGFTCECSPGFEGTMCEINTDECASDPCQNGVCEDGVDGFACECSPGYEGASCETDIDECSSDPCLNGATCVDGSDEFSCTCPAGFTGPSCENNTDECASNPCQNGVCADGVDGFTCECSPGYEGAMCEIDIDECGSNPCMNGATCVEGSNEFFCTCPAGFTGPLCENNIDECASNPCQNGVCEDGVDGFTCECSPGYEGAMCEMDIDECSSNPCLNGATCVDGSNEFSCTCPAGFTGPLCETGTNDCASNPCRNGVCEDGVDGFTCECSPGYEGTMCEMNIDECSSNPCLNGATCVDGSNEFSCTCPAGISGPLCENSTDINECASNPCQNGVCKDGVDGSTCECPPGFKGAMCEIDIDECSSDPCLNGATCVDGSNDFSCTCPAGYTGPLCRNNTNECASNLCQNGLCEDGVDGFSCECSPGYEGAMCETDIDECSSNPCLNGATCVDGSNAVTCTCPAGFTGTLCESPAVPTENGECDGEPCHYGVCVEDGAGGLSCQCSPGYEGAACDINIDECSSNPCQNGGRCMDGVDGFSCLCVVGFTGLRCEINYDECSSDPCQNGAECVDGIYSYVCNCAAGFTAAHCEENIDDCESDPCQNGASCVDGVEEFSCTCVTGYEGVYCETDIDECSSAPCQNGGRCQDGVNGFFCLCAEGFSGCVCEIDSNECDSSPCLSGVCIDALNGFTCACAPGFEGTFCEINIDECMSDPCQNGGTCEDGNDEVICTCAEGFYGVLCETREPQGVIEKLTAPNRAPEAEAQNSPWQVNLSGEYCISKVVILSRKDCLLESMTGAVVRAGTNSSLTEDSVCGSPVTASEGEERRASIIFVCDPPLTANYLSVDVPSEGSTQQLPEQYCEVTIERASPGPCKSHP